MALVEQYNWSSIFRFQLIDYNCEWKEHEPIGKPLDGILKRANRWHYPSHIAIIVKIRFAPCHGPLKGAVPNVTCNPHTLPLHRHRTLNLVSIVHIEWVVKKCTSKTQTIRMQLGYNHHCIARRVQSGWCWWCWSCGADSKWWAFVMRTTSLLWKIYSNSWTSMWVIGNNI